MSSIIARKEKEGLIYTNITKEYKNLLETIQKKRQELIQKFMEKKEDSYIYPDKELIVDFNKDYLGDLIFIHELELRTLIENALEKQTISNNIFTEIPTSIKKQLNALNMIILRYKRCFDLFFQAATYKRKFDWGSSFIGINFWSKPGSIDELIQKHNLPNKNQLKTLVENSLDTKICLDLILRINRFQGNSAKLTDRSEYTQYSPDEKGIKMGSGYFLNKEGKITNQAYPGKNFVIIGLEVTQIGSTTQQDITLNKESSSLRNMTPNLLTGLINWCIDRNPFGSSENYPRDNINWPLVWEKEDNDIDPDLIRFRFEEEKTGTYTTWFSSGKIKTLSNRSRSVVDNTALTTKMGVRVEAVKDTVLYPLSRDVLLYPYRKLTGKRGGRIGKKKTQKKR